MIDSILPLSTPLLMISGAPQTYKLITTKSSKGISRLTYFLTWCGVFLLAIDAISAKDLTLAVANCVSFIMLTLNLSLILYYDES